MLLIRCATPSDVADILHLIKELAIYERAEHEAIASEAQIHAVLFGEGAHCGALMAEFNGQIIGFALYFFNFSTWLGKPGLYLEDLYVTPDARRQGAGRALLAELAKIAEQKNCGRFEWSVLDWNQPAIDFYQSLGAVPQSEWTIFRLSGKGISELAKLT